MACILRPVAKFFRSLRKAIRKNKIEPDLTEEYDITPINDASWAITMKEKEGQSKATAKKPTRLAECQKGHNDLEIDRELLKMDLEEKQERAAKNKEMQQQQQKNKLKKHHTDVLFVSEMKRAGIQ